MQINLHFRSVCTIFVPMKRKVVTLILITLTAVLTAGAQQTADWERWLMMVMSPEDELEEDWEELLIELQELALQPRDINRMTREEWEALPFLTPRQVEQLVEYRERYGPMKSMNELRMLTAIEEPQRQLLQRFFYIGEEEQQGFPSLEHITQYGRHELMAYARIPTHELKGDNGNYLGYPYKHWLRYQFSYNDYVKAGIVGSQDAGEPFFANKNTMGYDFYSVYVQVNHWRQVETAVIGKYKVSTGLGLVMNNGFTLGKLAMLTQLGRNVKTLRAHSSRSTDYMQGAAATVRLGEGLTATAFVSYRPLDATLNSDGTARTLVTDGYHRTRTEMAKKNNTHAAETGVNLRYQLGRIHLGATALYSHLDRRLQPSKTQLYRRYQAQGNNFLNASIDYSYLSQRLTLSGETAINKDGALATLNSAGILLADGLSLLAVQRFYSYRYTALHANALSNGGQVQNESGVLVGLTWTPTPRWRFMGYGDYSYSPWARYRISQSSHAKDYLIQMTFSPKNWTLATRYRLRQRQRDKADSKTLEDYDQHTIRLWADWQNGGRWSTHTQIDHTTINAHDRGFMISQNVGYQMAKLRLSAGFGAFDCDSYDSRVYLYEPGPLYTFGVNQFSARGVRYWLMARWQPNRHLMLTAKVGTTDRQDADLASSDAEPMSAGAVTDIDVQLKWRF